MSLKIGINLNLSASDQSGILRELAQLAVKNGNSEDENGLYLDLCEREKEGTTGFGNQIAVPHAKSDRVCEAGVLVGRSRNKVEWNSIDEEPVSTWICLLTPPEGGTEHLQMLAKLSRKLMNQEFVSVLKTAGEDVILKQLNEILQ